MTVAVGVILSMLALWYGAVKWRAALDRSDRQFRRKFYEIDRSKRWDT